MTFYKNNTQLLKKSTSIGLINLLNINETPLERVL